MEGTRRCATITVRVVLGLLELNKHVFSAVGPFSWFFCWSWEQQSNFPPSPPWIFCGWSSWNLHLQLFFQLLTPASLRQKVCCSTRSGTGAGAGDQGARSQAAPAWGRQAPKWKSSKTHWCKWKQRFHVRASEQHTQVESLMGRYWYV